MTSLSRSGTTLSVDPQGNIIYFNDLRSERSGTTREMKGPSVLSPKESSVRWFILVVFSVFALLVSSRSDAQDVYNFYFQKNAPVPTTTTNSTTAQPAASVTETPAENKIEATKPTPKPAEEKDEFRRWEMMLSYATVSFSTNETEISSLDRRDDYEMSTNATGTGFMTSYRFNKFVSVDGAFYYIKTKDVGASRPYVNGALGFMITPLHINLFGYELIEFGVGGGVVTTNKLDTDYNIDTQESVVTDEARVFAPYAGVRLAINLAPQLAIVMDGRSVVGGDTGAGGGLAQLGMRYRF